MYDLETHLVLERQHGRVGSVASIEEFGDYSPEESMIAFANRTWQNNPNQSRPAFRRNVPALEGPKPKGEGAQAEPEGKQTYGYCFCCGERGHFMSTCELLKPLFELAAKTKSQAEKVKQKPGPPKNQAKGAQNQNKNKQQPKQGAGEKPSEPVKAEPGKPDSNQGN